MLKKDDLLPLVVGSLAAVGFVALVFTVVGIRSDVNQFDARIAALEQRAQNPRIPDGVAVTRFGKVVAVTGEAPVQALVIDDGGSAYELFPLPPASASMLCQIAGVASINDLRGRTVEYATDLSWINVLM